MVSLKAFLERKYGVKVPDDEATPEAFDTVGSIVAIVKRHGEVTATKAGPATTPSREALDRWSAAASESGRSSMNERATVPRNLPSGLRDLPDRTIPARDPFSSREGEDVPALPQPVPPTPELPASRPQVNLRRGCVAPAGHPIV